MKRYILNGGLLFFLALSWAGCSGKSADALFTEGERASHNVARYSQAEKLLAEFVQRFPRDARIDIALIALARIHQNQDRHLDAIAAYQKILDNYSDSYKADEAQFMIGFILDSLEDYEKARTAYQRVIDQFPHSDFVDDARISLEYLGKSPDKWLQITKEETLVTK